MDNLARLPVPNETILYAHPYNPDARGFYFSTLDEFERLSSRCRDRFGNLVEEFEIQYIDGDDSALFNAAGINQANLSEWFDEVESLDDEDKAKLFYLTDCAGYTLDRALEKIEDVCLHDGSLLDAATELFDECYLHDIPEAVRSYIDYEAFAYDRQLNGDMCEFRYSGQVFTCTNHNAL